MELEIVISTETNLSPKEAQAEYRALCAMVSKKDSAIAAKIKDRKAFIAEKISDAVVFGNTPPTATQKYPIPKIGESCDLDLPAALRERAYLENHPKPPHGWVSNVASTIANRLTTLNDIIAGLVANTVGTEERKHNERD